MAAEADAEHVVAPAFQPIGRAVNVVDAVDLQRAAFLDLRFDAKEAAVRQRAQVPDDFYWNAGIAVLDGSEIAQKIVLLGRIVVQPLDHVVNRRRIDVHDRFGPNHLGALDRRAVFVLQRLSRRIGFASAVWNVLLRCRLASGGGCSGSHDLERVHSPDLVWLTEFPNGSPSSSLTEGGEKSGPH